MNNTFVTLPDDRLAWLKSTGDALLDLLFPPHCVVCRAIGTWLCPRCLAQADTISPPVCARCGLPRDTVPGDCVHCHVDSSPLDGIRAAAYHSGPVRTAIHQLKYEDLRALARPLGAWMIERWAALAPLGWEPDVIVPVPLHPTRQRQRGYNQAALLARALGQGLQRTVIVDRLVRTRATAPQVGLSPPERRANVAGAFCCTANDFGGKCVLLVDDVYTTGSTLGAACEALLRAGASSVWAYCLARARPQAREI
ncbi:MAG: ComF family protein [Anaerolineae bacterium]|jgi:ComF family protein